MLVSAKFFEEAYVMGTQGMWGRDRGPDGRGQGEKKYLLQLRRRGRNLGQRTRQWAVIAEMGIHWGNQEDDEGFCFLVGSIFWFLDVE